MEILRTPEERFAALPEFPFVPHYVETGSLRIHYLDEGPREAEPILLLHGEPSWSYLYRKMIPVFTAAGYRSIAPDLVGFGRSDKPARREDYTYQRHVDWMLEVIETLDMQRATLFGQDWGGLIGLRLAAEHEQRFARIVVSNTFLPTGDIPPTEAFLNWQRYSQETPRFNPGGIVKGGCVVKPSQEIIDAYNAPFPDDGYMAGARQFPTIVPTTPNDPASEANRAAWQVLQHWEKPFLTAFSDSDAVTRGSDAYFQKVVPGTKGQPHTTIVGAGHFLQEDKGEELAHVIVDFMRKSSLA